MKYLILFSAWSLILITIGSTTAQPSYIYEGGNGGGETSMILLSTNVMLYKGNTSSGYASNSLFASNQILYKGDEGEGYTNAQISKVNSILYKGGENDGYVSMHISSNNNILYKGGSDDGYTSIDKREDFIWTGAIGQGWTVSGNWNFNIVPDITRRTIIPTGVPYYPHINAGLFAIGDNPNNGVFKSGELWIQENALLVTRVNNRIENYGKILIDGEMRVKKTTSNAFRNEEGAQVIISSTGELNIKP